LLRRTIWEPRRWVFSSSNAVSISPGIYAVSANVPGMRTPA
jgi:hypothetical protein